MRKFSKSTIDRLVIERDIRAALEKDFEGSRFGTSLTRRTTGLIRVLQGIGLGLVGRRERNYEPRPFQS